LAFRKALRRKLTKYLPFEKRGGWANLNWGDSNSENSGRLGEPPRHHQKWKTNLITKKKTTRYAATKPNRFHSRLDLGHHAQNEYAASRAFGATIKTCNHVGQAE
jgi:hypothetical protein